MGNIKIVEYHKGLAAQVADMWNKSHDGWGGGDTVKTAEDVERSEANSENLNLYLALDGEEVVGYCSLSEYRFDDDTMYIPLLNVRPDYHGKKIGKMLILKVLEKVMEMGWPRLDLFTWPGNTKAVPLYKKCGFFWEEMDESTHLMNFIPTVLKTEAIKDYFQEMDWYCDSTRHIEVKPDGIKENKFEYYEYSWEKDSRRLRVQFERRGRGLRLIETDDYLIQATVEKLNLVFGRDYKIEYKVINKSGKPLNIEILGTKVKNIDNTFKVAQEVTSEVIITNNFSVAEIEEEQSNFKTHPTVAAKVKINGKEAFFQVGLIPEFPAKLVFNGSKELCYLGKRDQFYLDIENKFDEEGEFVIDLPSTEFMDLEDKQLTVPLEANSRTSVPLNYVLKGFGFYNPKLKVNVTLKNGDKVCFEKETGIGFKGANARFFGETEKYWEIYNDKYLMKVEKEDNWQIPTRQVDDGHITAFLPPRIGKPFYDEFGKKRPIDFKFHDKNGVAILEYTLVSDKKRGIHLKTIQELYSNGLLSTKYEVINLGEETLEEIHLAAPIMHHLERAVFPIKNEYIELNDSVGAEYGYWEAKDLSENWIFATSKKIPRGLCWPKEFEPEFKGWHMMLTTNLGKIGAKSSVSTNPIHISVGAFNTWQEFRAFAMAKNVEDLISQEPITLKVNGGNPFVGEELTVSIKDNRTSYLDGEITVNLGDVTLSKLVCQNEKNKEVTFDLKTEKPVQYVNSTANLTSLEINKQRIIFKKGSNKVDTSVVEEQGHKVYFADNGVIKIKAAPTFAANLFSLEYQGKQWLDNSFPKVGPKSWWSPWQGGLFGTPESLLLRSTLREEISAEFVEIKDLHENLWSGIKITVKVNNHEKFKGLVFHQYYLMLPNVPVVCHFNEVEQNTGTFITGEWMNSYYFKADEDLNTCFLKYQNSIGEWVKIKAGEKAAAFDGHPHSTITVESTKQRTMIQLVSDFAKKNQMLSVNQEVVFLMDFTKFAWKNGENIKLKPNFLVLTDERINDLALKDLLALRF